MNAGHAGGGHGDAGGGAADPAVLIVDDDPGVRRTYAKLLRRAGFSVTTASDALAAFEELRKQPFGAILLDIQMPSLTGTHLFEQLVEQLPHMAKRVVFVSGFVDVPNTHEFLVKTGRPFIAKPIAGDDLVDTVRRIIENTAREPDGSDGDEDGEAASSD